MNVIDFKKKCREKALDLLCLDDDAMDVIYKLLVKYNAQCGKAFDLDSLIIAGFENSDGIYNEVVTSMIYEILYEVLHHILEKHDLDIDDRFMAVRVTHTSFYFYIPDLCLESDDIPKREREEIIAEFKAWEELSG